MSEQSFRVREVSAKKMFTKIGHYIIGISFSYSGELLGTGGYATVHKATEIFTKMEVAVKIIDLTRFSQRDVARIKRECDILRELSHPNIVRIYEFLEFNSKLYIFMELIRGKELFELVSKKGPILESFAAKIFHQICSAVKYLHEQGIVHRDIKTENIMVDSSCNAKLIDFGLAKKFSIREN